MPDTHQCPICGAIDNCDVFSSTGYDEKHNCRFCGSTWDSKSPETESKGTLEVKS